MHQTSLSDEELAAILPLVDSIRAEHAGGGDRRLVELAPRYGHELPGSVRRFLEEYRTAVPSALCLLSGFPVDDDAIGPTPAHGARGAGPSPALRQQVFFLLCATVLGDRIAWAPPEDGDAAGASGPVEADHVGLLCLRNADDVATTICDLDWIDWSRLDVGPLLSAGVLVGDRDRPSLAPSWSSTARDLPPAARAAFDAFTRAADQATNGFVLWPGDIAFIDNRRAVHGQEPFDARGDGTDQWLERLAILREPARDRMAVAPGRSLDGGGLA